MVRKLKKDEFPLEHHHHIKHLKKHRNVLYGIVMMLLLLNIVSFVSISSQISKVTSEQGALKSDIKDSVSNLDNKIEDVRRDNQFQTNAITQELATQRRDIQSQINLLKTGKGDFSGVIESSIKGVATIITDKSAGSGIIVSNDGFVITNLHVIQGSSIIQVHTFDKKVFSAELFGVDGFSDMALLKAEGDFDRLEFANSDEVQIGEKVIAIGNPLGLSFTVTEGIVSAVDRLGPNGLEAYIQTDVTLNPGNSGGPLINTEGKVIGINNFKIGGAESLGFALESNFVRDRINLLVNDSLIL